MKSIFLFALLVSSAAHANCGENAGKLVDQKFNAALTQGVLSFFKSKDIAVDPAKVSMKFSTSGFQTNFPDPTNKYVLVDGIGEVTSASNTNFLVSTFGPDRDDDGNPTGYLTIYLAVLTSDGFDKEGNAINPHCTLKLSDGGIPNYANTYQITNRTTDKVLATLPLPKAIVLY